MQFTALCTFVILVLVWLGMIKPVSYWINQDYFAKKAEVENDDSLTIEERQEKMLELYKNKEFYFNVYLGVGLILVILVQAIVGIG